MTTTTMTITEAHSFLSHAQPEDVFSGTPDTYSATYKQWAKIVHPDLYVDGAERAFATEAFQYLNDLKNRANPPAKTTPKQPNATVQSKKDTYVMLENGPMGAVTSTRLVESSSSRTRSWLKVARSPKDNDLMAREAKALKLMNADNTSEVGRQFVPDLVDSFFISAGAGKVQANVVNNLEGFYTLSKIREYFPKGLDPKHVVWIFRRLLVAIDHAHQNGIIHGAVVPDNVMILPEQHGLVLVGWTYSTVKDPVTSTYPAAVAVDSSQADWYPEEVKEKKPLDPALDVRMAAQCMLYLLGPANRGASPFQLFAFLKGCVLASLALTPSDALLLLDEFDEMLENIGPPYYPRRFLPLELPTNKEK